MAMNIKNHLEQLKYDMMCYESSIKKKNYQRADAYICEIINRVGNMLDENGIDWRQAD